MPEILYFHIGNLGYTESPRGLQEATVHNGETQEYTYNTGGTLRNRSHSIFHTAR